MCGNFTYEVVGQRRRLKTIVPQKLNVILFFDIELNIFTFLKCKLTVVMKAC
jgi:hypothetical protein